MEDSLNLSSVDPETWASADVVPRKAARQASQRSRISRHPLPSRQRLSKDANESDADDSLSECETIFCEDESSSSVSSGTRSVASWVSTASGPMSSTTSLSSTCMLIIIPTVCVRALRYISY
jgi:hypothetical protein